MPSTDRKALGLLTLLVLLTTLPFLKRAYFVDDFYFVTIARGILQHPLRPYDFRSDDAGIQTIGWERGKPPRMVNPLFFHYYLAGVMKLLGDESWKLRASTLIFSLMAVWSTYFLGKRFVPHPLAAASLMAVTPCYWLTSYSLLIDSGMIGLFLLSLLVYFDALDRRKVVGVLLAGLLMGLTMLTKYVGALVVVLAFIWQIMEPPRRRWLPGYLAYGVAGAAMLGWGVWNIATYGQMHFLAALPRGFHSTSYGGIALLGVLIAAFCVSGQGTLKGISWPRWMLLAAALLIVAGLFHSSSLRSWIGNFYIDKILVLASFVGGCTVFVWAALPLLALQRSRAFLELLVFSIFLFLAFHSRVGGFGMKESFLMTFFIASTAAFLVLSSTTVLKNHSQESVFLLSWIAIGSLELVTVMPWTAARYLLILLPPLCWAFQWIVPFPEWRKTWVITWLLTAFMGGSLAYADYAQAGCIHDLADFLVLHNAEFRKLSDPTQHHWYYLADTFDGSQPYIVSLGWQNVFPYQTFQPGDLFLQSHFRKSSWWKIAHPEQFQLVAWDAVPSANPLRVMDVPASAGFYASCWGALPYTVTNHPLERFELYQAVRLPSHQ